MAWLFDTVDNSDWMALETAAWVVAWFCSWVTLGCLVAISAADFSRKRRCLRMDIKNIRGGTHLGRGTISTGYNGTAETWHEPKLPKLFLIYVNKQIGMSIPLAFPLGEVDAVQIETVLAAVKRGQNDNPVWAAGERLGETGCYDGEIGRIPIRLASVQRWSHKHLKKTCESNLRKHSGS